MPSLKGPEHYIEVFRQVIEATWDLVSSVDPDPDRAGNGLSATLGDWQQIQWEVLVEGHLQSTGQLSGYLAHYGEGMDEGISMRYSQPNARPTHEVCFIPRTGNAVLEVIGGTKVTFPARGLSLGEFVSLCPHPWYMRKPPFTHVLARDSSHDGLPLVFERERVCFTINPLED